MSQVVTNVEISIGNRKLTVSAVELENICDAVSDLFHRGRLLPNHAAGSGHVWDRPPGDNTVVWDCVGTSFTALFDETKSLVKLTVA